MEESILFYILSIPLGILVGIIGALTGIGGGFILMPILLLIFPEKTPSELAAIIMTVIFVNSVTGTISNFKLKTINYKTGILFSIFSIPTVILGNYLRLFIDSKRFALFFGLFLILSSVFIFFSKTDEQKNLEEEKSIIKIITGCAVSILIGLISSFFGIGGGFIFVPFLIYFLKFQVKNATATSLFILIFISLTIIVLSIINQNYKFEIYLMCALIIGVIIGSKIGSILTVKINHKIILKILCGLLILAGIKLIFF
jgi:uncharacterized protein